MAKLLDITGKALPGEWGMDDDVGTGVPVLRTTNFTNEGVIDFSNIVTRTITKKRISEKYLRYGDIILEKSGGSDKQPVGRVVFFEGAENTYLFNNFTGLLRVKDTTKWLPRYVFYSLFARYLAGGTRPFENRTTGLHNLQAEAYINSVVVPDATMEMQREVCYALDAVLRVASARRRQFSALDDLVKARFVEMFSEIQKEVPLSHYIKSLVAGKSLAGEKECGNKVLKSGAVTYDHFEPEQVKNLPFDYTPLPEHQIHEGDVIISRMNTAELVGATAYVWNAPMNTYLPDRLWRADLKNGANPIFVWQTIVQPETKDAIRKIASGTSGTMKNISKAGLLGIRVKYVDCKAQNDYANFVAQVDKSKFRELGQFLRIYIS